MTIRRPTPSARAPKRRRAGTSLHAGSQKPERRARGFIAAGECARPALRASAGKRGIAEARLLTRWPEIVGAELAAATRPIRLKSARGGWSLSGVLVLSVEGAGASEIEHRIPTIIERVNAYYGYNAVGEVKLTQAVGGLAGRAADRPRRAAAREDLDAEQQSRLARMTDGMGGDTLQAALSSLGANVIAKRARRADKGATTAAGTTAAATTAAGTGGETPKTTTKDAPPAR